MSTFQLKGTSGRVINQSWPLEESAVIGSSEACEIQVDSDTVAPRHAALEVAVGQVNLRLLAGGGELFLNGEAVEQAALFSGDEIRIGSSRWLLQAPGLRPERVLTEKAVRRRVRLLPWLIAGGVSALVLLAWRLGYIPL
jgi:pSer/pThr/pTyr-binding forkhead associated (FHA) protein